MPLCGVWLAVWRILLESGISLPLDALCLLTDLSRRLLGTLDARGIVFHFWIALHWRLAVRAARSLLQVGRI